MAGIRFSMLRSIRNSISFHSSASAIQAYGSFGDSIRIGRISNFNLLAGFGNRSYHVDERSKLSNSSCQVHRCIRNSVTVSSFAHIINARYNFPLFSMTPVLSYQSYSSVSGNKRDNSKEVDVPEASGASGADHSGGSDGVLGSEWIDKLKDGYQSVVDAVVFTGQKAKESSDNLSPYIQRVFDANPYLKEVVVPVGGTLVATLMAWLVMPRILKRFHKYSQQGSAALLAGSVFAGEVPYEKSLWGALEDPVRYLITFIAFSQVASMVAPNAIPSDYILRAWSGAAVMSLLWFVHRWKTNVFSRVLAAQSTHSFDRQKLLTLDRVSTVGLFVMGLMALSEACGVAVQSVLTVGGIGGVATAFAARDILGNVLSGLAVQFSRPFSLGDTIRAGSIEGQVVDMGLTTTSLLDAEKFPVIVPNSLFSSQVIVNKSRAKWRAHVTKIPLQFDDVEKVPQISEDIKSMLKSNPKVFLGKEAPYCRISRIDSSYVELTIGCNLRHMSKDELYPTEMDILLQSIRIIKNHGVTLGATWPSGTS